MIEMRRKDYPARILRDIKTGSEATIPAHYECTFFNDGVEIARYYSTGDNLCILGRPGELPGPRETVYSHLLQMAKKEPETKNTRPGGNEGRKEEKMNTNLENMKCNELRTMAKDLGIKGYGSKGKEWLIPQITAVMKAKEEEAKAAERKPAKEKKARTTNLIEHNGKAQSLGAWAKELGMPEATLRARLRSGWTVEQALSMASGKKTEKQIEFNGKSQSLTAWAKELGLPRGTLEARINRFHWPLEKALAARA